MTVPVDQIENSEALDKFYTNADPWNYDSHEDDHRRVGELLALVGRLQPLRTLDIGCGNGFLTLRLPGESVIGIDISPRAVEYAGHRAASRADAERFSFRAASLFELSPETLGRFDLVVVTGVLYPQYIGAAISVARQVIDALVTPGGFIASCHITEWNPPRLAHLLVDEIVYPYRERFHRLELVRK